MSDIIKACLSVLKSVFPESGEPMLSEAELERFSREFALSYYIEEDEEDEVTISDRLDALEHVATYGNDIVPMDWLVLEEDEDLPEESIMASEMLKVTDDCAKTLVEFMVVLNRYLKHKGD